MSGANPYAAHSVSGVERIRAERTLICLLRGCESKIVVVELRNETKIAGRLLNCDGWMNLVIKNATMKRPVGSMETFDELHIVGTNVRYVVLPDEINITKTIGEQLGKMRKTRSTGSTHGHFVNPNLQSLGNKTRVGNSLGKGRGRGLLGREMLRDGANLTQS